MARSAVAKKQSTPPPALAPVHDVSDLTVHPVVLVPISAINPAPYNPRKIGPEMLNSLKENIRAHGFVQPIVIQKTGMVLIGGHQRLRAVKELCIEEGRNLPQLPAVILDVDDRTAKKMNIALNKISGDFDVPLLSELLETMHEVVLITQDEVMMMGFEPDDFGKLIQLNDPPPALTEPPSGFARSITLSLTFESLEMRDALKKHLTEQQEVLKKTPGEIVYNLFLAGRKPKTKK
jgi:ParB-like chromosome segregation protein Spo0J